VLLYIITRRLKEGLVELGLERRQLICQIRWGWGIDVGRCFLCCGMWMWG
jgi:hypothetical protein